MDNLNNQAIELKQEWLENPLLGVISFFETYSLHEALEKIDELFTGWGDLAEKLDMVDELIDMVFFYQQLLELLQLCYVLKKKSQEE